MTINNIPITTVGTFDKPWFSGKELFIALGYQHPKKVLFDHVKAKHKTTLAELKKGHDVNTQEFHWPFSNNFYFNEGKAVYINRIGVKTVITKSKLAGNTSPNSFQTRYISTSMSCHLTKEQETVSAIIDVFPDYKCIRQFSVLNYRIYLYLPEVALAIECDKFNHRRYNLKEEQERERAISEELGCTFFRNNPDSKNFNVFRMIGYLRNEIASIGRRQQTLKDSNIISEICELLQEALTE
jgi:very-short-patch-repair endonuclease